MDVRGYLESKGLGPIRSAGPTDVHLPCFYCNEAPNKRGRLYVNVDPGADIPGLFLCHLCGQKGALASLKKFFGDPTTSDEDRTWERRQVLGKAAKFYHECLKDKPDVLDWLHNERGLSDETIDRFRLGWAEGGLYDHLKAESKLEDMVETGLVLHNKSDFFRGHVTIPYHSTGNVVMIRGKEIGGKYLTPSGQKTRLFNSDAGWEAQDCWVVEGEFDCLVMGQMGFNAVGVPGANVWQPSWDGIFENSRRVFICFDPDEAGKTASVKIKDRLGPKARLIDLPIPDDAEPKDVDPSWLVVKKGMKVEDFQTFIHQASGGILKTIPYVATRHKEMETVSGLKFGIDNLDAVIRPGLLPTQLFTLLARSGVGKSVMLLNMAQRMSAIQPDCRFLLLSLELTDWQCWERITRIHRFYHLSDSDKEAEEYWTPRLMIADPNRMNEKGLYDAIDDFEYELGAKPDVVMVDYMGYWAQSFKGEAYSRTTAAAFSLKEIAKERNLAVITPHQLNRNAEPGCEPSPDDARDAGTLLETSDFLISLWNADEKLGTKPEERQGEIHGRLNKSRHGGAGTLLRFQFAPMTLALVPMEDPLRHRAELELDRLVAEDRRLELGLRGERITWNEMIDQHLEREATGSPDSYSEDF